MLANLQTILIGVAVLVTGIYTLTGFHRDTDDGDNPRIVYKAGRWKANVAVGFVLVFLAASVAIVPRGYAGVIYDWDGGIQQEELGEGLNLVVPFKQHATNVDVRVKVWVHNDETVYVHTLDFHEIRVPFAVNWRIKASDAALVLQNVSGDPAETILRHAALLSLRTEVGKIRLDELAQSVSDIALAIQATITPQAEKHGIEIVYVSIEDSVVNAQFIAAVNQERISERNIITAKNQVEVAINQAREVRERAKGDGDALTTIGEGEAGAIDAIAQALGFTQDEYLLWLRLTEWDGVLPQTVLGDTDVIVSLP